MCWEEEVRENVRALGQHLGGTLHQGGLLWADVCGVGDLMSSVYYHEGRFPPEERLEWPRLIPLIGPAVAAVARYDGVLAAVPNPRVLMTTQEAVVSSRIEGTQATMSEVLEFEAGHEARSPQRRDDIHEVLNYRAAMLEAERMLDELPLWQRVVRQAHRIVLSGVRGEGKSPGDYRRIPNWIGPPGCTLEEATFVPVGAERLTAAMSAWERYVNQDAPDRLVQLAVIHAEFEALHPFLDGNGRLGRMLVPLSLWQCGLIRRPMFFLHQRMVRGPPRCLLRQIARGLARRRLDWIVPVLPRSGLGAGRGESDQGKEDPHAFRGHEGAGGGCDAFPLRHPHIGLNLRAPDLQQRQLRGQGRYPGPHCEAASDRVARARDPAGVQSRQRSPRDHFRVSGFTQRRRRTRRILMITDGRQTGLGGWAGPGRDVFGGHTCPSNLR